MARPAQVKMPGQKQRLRMRGTKTASQETQRRLRRNLEVLLDQPETVLPVIEGPFRSRFGRKHPLQRSLSSIQRVLRRKRDVAWLRKRASSRRMDALAKAWAGSLFAAHDDDISTVQKFDHPSFGRGSYLRRGDGKAGYLAGIQNHHNPTLRMLPYEEHAKHGAWFFSASNRFVCTGTTASVPEGWLEDVLNRSRFGDVAVWHDEVCIIGDLDPSIVRARETDAEGYVRMTFDDGRILAIGFDALERGPAGKSFVHHMAMSMLPPKVSEIADAEAIWAPDAWVGDLPDEATRGMEQTLGGWMGLVINEGVLVKGLLTSALIHLDSGLVLEDTWFPESAIEEALASCSGSDQERRVMASIIERSLAAGEGFQIGPDGEMEEREVGACLIRTTSLNTMLGAVWEDHGLDALVDLGIDPVAAADLHHGQVTKRKPFGAFLRTLDEVIAERARRARFPHASGVIGPPVGRIHDLVIQSLLEGKGRAEKAAVKGHATIEEGAASWAWLVAVGRHRGQEWHFEPSARERGQGWVASVEDLQSCGEALLEAEDVATAQVEWLEQVESVRMVSGQTEAIPEV